MQEERAGEWVLSTATTTLGSDTAALPADKGLAPPLSRGLPENRAHLSQQTGNFSDWELPMGRACLPLQPGRS